MTDLLIFLSSNVLKVTYLKKDGFGGFSFELPNSIVNDSEILDVEKFSESLRTFLVEAFPSGVKGSTLSFMVNPEQVFLFFIPVSKNGESVGDQIVANAKARLPGDINIDALYFSFQKIAPFIYQFVAVKKEELEKFLAVSNILGMSLKGVIPWVLLLPKLVNDNKAAIFISKNPDGKQTVALSELGGIYFAQTYEEEKGQKDLIKLVQQLSLYNRTAPINKIYTVNYGAIVLGDSYEVLPLDVPGDTREMEGYDVHLLHNKVTLENPDLLTTQVNLLTLLPVPVVQKSKIQVAQTVAIAIPMVIMLLIGGFFFFRQNKKASTESSNVLSDTSETTASEDVAPAPDVEEEPKVELKKSDLKIRVENGTDTAGLASKTQTFLKDLGYQVLSIGDSQKSGLVVTLVSLKESTKDFEALLTEDMKESYTLKVDYALSEDTEYDVLITVGLSE